MPAGVSYYLNPAGGGANFSDGTAWRIGGDNGAVANATPAAGDEAVIDLNNLTLTVDVNATIGKLTVTGSSDSILLNSGLLIRNMNGGLSGFALTGSSSSVKWVQGTNNLTFDGETGTWGGGFNFILPSPWGNSLGGVGLQNGSTMTVTGAGNRECDVPITVGDGGTTPASSLAVDETVGGSDVATATIIAMSKSGAVSVLSNGAVNINTGKTWGISPDTSDTNATTVSNGGSINNNELFGTTLWYQPITSNGGDINVTYGTFWAASIEQDGGATAVRVGAVLTDTTSYTQNGGSFTINSPTGEGTCNLGGDFDLEGGYFQVGSSADRGDTAGIQVNINGNLTFGSDSSLYIHADAACVFQDQITANEVTINGLNAYISVVGTAFSPGSQCPLIHALDGPAGAMIQGAGTFTNVYSGWKNPVALAPAIQYVDVIDGYWGIEELFTP